MNHLSLTLDRFSMAFMSNPDSTNPRKPSSAPAVEAMAASETASSEALLVAVANSQDRAAFNALYQRFAKRILAMGMKLTRNEQLSHDLIQEVMLMVWQKAPLFDLDKGSAESWIFTLTRNRCFDMLRKIKRQPSCVSADDIWPIDGEPVAAEAETDMGMQTVEMDQIRAMYLNLPDAQRIVVEHIYVQDMTHEEAALALNIPLGTLKSRLRLGMEKLRHMVGAAS